MAIPFILPPRGRVALVHGEVAHAASLAAQDPEALGQALEVHDALVRRLAARLGGHVVSLEGHHFLIAWDKPDNALAFCASFRTELLELHWPLALLALPEGGVVRDDRDLVVERGLRVRVAVHLGEPEVIDAGRPRNPLYRGAPVAHVARLCNAAWPGQVLVSAAAKEAASEVPAGWTLQPLGVHRLAGLHASEPLWRLEYAPWATAGARPPRTLDHVRTNLAEAPDTFIGRDEEIASIRELVGLGARHLVLVGPPGGGRSRLLRRLIELEVAAVPEGGGAWVVRSSGARGLPAFLRGVASVLDVSLALCRGVEDAAALIGRVLRSRSPVLLGLDDLDVAGPRALNVVAGWVREAPGLRVFSVSTPEAALGNGVRFEISGLSLPDEGRADAVVWFEQAARKVRPSFRALASEGRPVFDVVRTLEGSPLAIQLVAAHVDEVLPAELFDAITARAQILPPGPSRPLAVALAWCGEQLRLWEREALGQLSVFADGFDADAAAAIVDLGEHPAAPSLHDVLQRLTEAALIFRFQSQQSPGVPRYRIPGPVSAAAAAWVTPGARSAAEDRLARWAIEVGERCAALAERRGRAEALARLELECPNLLAVHQRQLAEEPPTPLGLERALRVALALTPLYEALGTPVEQLGLLDAVFASPLAEHAVDERLRVRVHLARADAWQRRGLLAEARGELETARMLARDCHDERGEGRVLVALALHWRLEGRDEQAAPLLEAAANLARENDDLALHGRALAALAGSAQRRGEVTEARELFERAIEHSREAGDDRAEAQALTGLGVLLRQTGEPDAARTCYLRAIDAHQRGGDRLREATALVNLGAREVHAGAFDEGRLRCEQARRLGQDLGARLVEGSATANLGLVALEHGDIAEAARLLAEATAVLDGEASDVRGAVMGQLALARWRGGDLDEARSTFVEALGLLRRAGESRLEAAVRSWAAALEVEAGELAAADALMHEAERLLPASRDPGVRAALDLLAAGLHLAHGASGARERAQAALEDAAHAPVAVEVRMARAWLRERLSR